MSKLFVKPRGSKPTSPTIVPSSAGGCRRKGNDLDISPACKDIVVLAVDAGVRAEEEEEGANAMAEPTRVERTASFIMVVLRGE